MGNDTAEDSADLSCIYDFMLILSMLDGLMAHPLL